MKITAIYFVCIFGFVAHAEFQPLINGGTPVPKGEPIARSTVQIDLGLGACTATIIAKDTLLSAAHCLAHTPYDLRIRWHGYETNEVSAAGPYKVHEKYAPESETGIDDADVAIVHFEGGLPEGYEPVEILPDSVPMNVGDEVEVAGYGQAHSGRLYKVTLSVMDFPETKTQLKFKQTKDNGACFGDSGGPAYRTVDGKLYVTGITSWGEENCDGYVVYTKPQSYRSWIEKNAKALRKH